MPVPQKWFAGKVLGFEKSTKFVEKCSCDILKMKNLCFCINLLLLCSGSYFYKSQSFSNDFILTVMEWEKNHINIRGCPHLAKEVLRRRNDIEIILKQCVSHILRINNS